MRAVKGSKQAKHAVFIAVHQPPPPPTLPRQGQLASWASKKRRGSPGDGPEVPGWAMKPASALCIAATPCLQKRSKCKPVVLIRVFGNSEKVSFN